MTASPDPAAQQKTILETGKEYLDAAVKSAKAHPAATAGIAAGVAAAAAGAVYGASKLRERGAIGDAGSATDEAGIIDPQRVPEALPINGE
ncbi:hypothetical protein D1610_11970 [Sphingomonas gilva]|uniref:Uncharacterized protein n=1 Tax=Sphingomonas gilva TaxID=2305907 RepID=A0A396RU76_9SPHN|nr:hypothetical protein [Sphingomonas gilva]RHW17251.1 hypothetical protein D1610_11970 [Sphingomonas gilva]